MKQRLSLSGWRLSVDGFSLSYTQDGVSHSTSFDPCATCAFFKDCTLIEDFTQDSNGEPVILYTDGNEPQGYGYELWHRFAKSFPLCDELAFALLEYKISREESEAFQTRVESLLAPLAA